MFPVDSHFTLIRFLAALPLALFVSMLFCAFSWNTLMPLTPLSKIGRVTGWIFCWAAAVFCAYLTQATQSKLMDSKSWMLSDDDISFWRHHGMTAAEALRQHHSSMVFMESQRVSLYQTLYSEVWSCGSFLILPLIGYGFSRLHGRWAGWMDRILGEDSQSRRRFLILCWIGTGSLALITWLLHSIWLGKQTFVTAWYSWLFGKPGNLFLGLQCQTLIVLVIFVILLFLTPFYLLGLQRARRIMQLKLSAKPA